MANLGAAGCRWGDGHFCSFLEENIFGYGCKKYHIDLGTHWSGDPWRAGICGDEAEKDAWSKIIKRKKMG